MPNHSFFHSGKIPSMITNRNSFWLLSALAGAGIVGYLIFRFRSGFFSNQTANHGHTSSPPAGLLTTSSDIKAPHPRPF